ncbi:MAG: iron-containing alcohol dehydrogenase [Bacilli bacterium]|nr:iron-containing alcohol dehydrogenase [Bacilli bacterium]
MNNFIYNIPTKVYFGKDEELKIGKLIKEYHAHKVLIHFGSNRVKKNGLVNRVEKCLKKEGIKYIEFCGVTANPVLSFVRKGIALAKKEKVDFVLAIGGGSVLDSAKAIAIGVANPKVDVWDYFCGKPAPTKSLPKAAILTISAAGSEMSNSAVITNEKTKEKKGFNNVINQMDFAIENPDLTLTVDKYQTACGAVDIAMHTMERYFSPVKDTILTDALALALIKTVNELGLKCIKKPNDYVLRANMMWASSLAHNGLTGFGKEVRFVVHPFGHQVCGLYPNVAHAAGLSAIWGSWARYVYKYDLKCWQKFAKEVWNTDDVLKAIKKQEDYYHKVGMPISLRELKIKKSDLEKMALRLSNNKTTSLSGVINLKYEDMIKIYTSAY